MMETFDSLRWMVWYDDFNKKSIELFNIFSHYSFNKEIEKLLSERTNKEEFSTKVKNALMYYFWCKAEYECYISSEFHFASRKAMNIDGLGDRIVEDFYNLGFIHKFSDLYKLHEYKKDLVELEGFGDKSIDYLMDAIAASKEQSLEKLIFGLGIPNVGEKTAKVLAMNYENLDNLINATEEELTNIPDIGNIIAKSIKEYFALSFNKEEIEKLKELGINMMYTGPKISINENFYNKTFVITGTLEKYTRDEIEEKIELLGGKTSSSVSKKTSALIVGSSPGSKYEKAQKLEIPIWSEEDFDKLIKEV